MYSNIAGVEASLLVIKISKRTFLKRWRFIFVLKPKKTKQSTDPTPRKHSRNMRVTNAEKLGTMSTSNLRATSSGIRPLWGIHYLALIISWFDKNYQDNVLV